MDQHEPSIPSESTSDGATKSDSAEALPEPAPEEDAEGGSAAFNPDTGEINWDCPCLGGMAHGPCGQQFREAFSCFIFSEKEPKGIDCVELFKAMQDCFREHPEVYGDGQLTSRPVSLEFAIADHDTTFFSYRHYGGR